MLLIMGRLASEGPEAEKAAAAAIDSEVKKIIDGDMTDFELTRAVNRMESAQMFDNLSYLSKAQNLALAEYHGETLDGNIARYRALDREAVAAHAAEIFNPARLSTLIYRPA